jgi:hypothetical protein
MIDDTAYERDRDALRAKLTIASPSLPLTDLRPVATLLGNLPELLKEATTEERRAILVQLVDQVYLKHGAVLGIRPTLRAWPLMHVVYAQFLHSVTWWAGWAPGTNSPPSVKNTSCACRCIVRSRTKRSRLALQPIGGLHPAVGWWSGGAPRADDPGMAPPGRGQARDSHCG